MFKIYDDDYDDDDNYDDDDDDDVNDDDVFTTDLVIIFCEWFITVQSFLSWQIISLPVEGAAPMV